MHADLGMCKCGMCATWNQWLNSWHPLDIIYKTEETKPSSTISRRVISVACCIPVIIYFCMTKGRTRHFRNLTSLTAFLHNLPLQYRASRWPSLSHLSLMPQRSQIVVALATINIHCINHLSAPLTSLTWNILLNPLISLYRTYHCGSRWFHYVGDRTRPRRLVTYPGHC